MTRKKFIKMLMWAGMSRNDAADVAALAQDAKRPYFWVLGDLLNWHRQDFGNPLAWLKIRRTVIHGYNTPPWRIITEIDEAHTLKDSRVVAALEACVSVKPCVVHIDTRNPNMWPAQTAAAWAFAQAEPQEERMEWPKANPAIDQKLIDQLDALRYAIQAGGAGR